MHNIFHLADKDAAGGSAPHAPAPCAQVFVERRRYPRALPVPDVIEGTGGETDWALWTQSVREQQETGAADADKSA